MKGSTCTCGKTVAVVREVCPQCGRAAEPVELSEEAVVLTYTTVHVVPEGFSAPIHLVLVGLERGAKVMCESKEEGVEIGGRGRVVGEGGKLFFIKD